MADLATFLMKPKGDLDPEVLAIIEAYLDAFEPPILKPAAAAGGSAELLCSCGVSLTAFIFGSFTWGLQNGVGYCSACDRVAVAYHRIYDDATGQPVTAFELVLLPKLDGDPSRPCGRPKEESGRRYRCKRGRMHVGECDFECVEIDLMKALVSSLAERR